MPSLVDRLATAIDRRSREADRAEAPSRLAETAVKASAAAVAPVAFATQPVSARELLNRTCASCPSGSRCCGGFSAFCCTLPGGDNYGCPPGAYIGGWWQCNYGGNGLCGTTNVRYYLDCNTLPGRQCAGGCHCGNDDCNNFKSCCIDFRYGQCNPQIHGVGVIHCRLVTCMIPCRIDCMNCNCSAAVDQLTCTHDAGCL
jgi:hypothetical protein